MTRPRRRGPIGVGCTRPHGGSASTHIAHNTIDLFRTLFLYTFTGRCNVWAFDYSAKRVCIDAYILDDGNGFDHRRSRAPFAPAHLEKSVGDGHDNKLLLRSLLRNARKLCANDCVRAQITDGSL